MDPYNVPIAYDVPGNHSEIVHKIAEAWTVLFKNSNNVLLLKDSKNVGVFGNGAAGLTEDLTFTGGNSDPWDANIGALSVGGGSGAGRHNLLVSPLSAICNRGGSTAIIEERLELLRSFDTHFSDINTIPWATNPNVTTILAEHYPGQENGNSLMDVLYGDVNPSGRLPYTIHVSKTPADYNFSSVNITGPQAADSSAWQADFSLKV